MCSNHPTKPSTAGFSAQLRRLKQELEAADAILIGAGAGLSAAAGLTYAGERFARRFGDFAAQYGFRDMYTGGFYPFATPEERWAYWSRFILCNRYEDAPRPVYRNLLALVAARDYFVLTTNVDHQFQRAGFDKRRLFYTQGDYGLFQCSVPCCRETYDNEALVRRMAAEQKNRHVPAALLPVCPACGAPLTMNLRCDDRFVEDAGWHEAAARYDAFIRRCRNQRVLFWELGVGFNTPGIIKYPFWEMTRQNPRAAYACVNLNEAAAPDGIKPRAVCLTGDIAAILEQLL